MGAEAFCPPNESSQLGLFTLQEMHLGALGLEAAGRFEKSDVNATTLGFDRSFNAYSAAIGASYDVNERVKVGVNGSRAERAPSAEELFSNGPPIDRKSTRLNSSHSCADRMPSSACQKKKNHH